MRRTIVLRFSLGMILRGGGAAPLPFFLRWNEIRRSAPTAIDALDLQSATCNKGRARSFIGLCDVPRSQLGSWTIVFPFLFVTRTSRGWGFSLLCGRRCRPALL